MNERPHLHSIPGGWADQVPRRARFEAEHPEVSIELLGHAGPWQGVIPAQGGGREVVTRYELRDLLDELERRLALREEGAGQQELR
jgi:hypothetical protein